MKQDKRENLSIAQMIVLLEDFFNWKFKAVQLESHGLDHHRRVWNYARELTGQEAQQAGDEFNTKLLIACYLHDIGMSVDAGEKHGQWSRKLCEEFLSGIHQVKENFSDLLDAIEYHDNKNYSEDTGVNSLLLYLSVADDLDAFGYTGVFRYLEIYLRRGIKPSEIGSLVIKNARSRFTNFENHFGKYPRLLEKHRSRFKIVIDFFSNLDAELADKQASI